MASSLTKERPKLEAFENKFADRTYTIEIRYPEFTSVCPKTGLPDFGEIIIKYIPDKFCVELKTLKLYLHSYRNDGIFYEHVVNKVMDDFVACCDPLEIEVIGNFNPRGGITTTVRASHKKNK